MTGLAVDIDVFDYGDFRKFLADWLEAARRVEPKVSHRWFMQRVGSHDPSGLKHVINGRRNLTEERIPAFLDALELAGDDALYFHALVVWGQAKTREAGDAAFARVSEIRGRQAAGDMARADTFALMSTWLVPAVLEMVKFPDFVEDPAWIAAHTHKPVSHGEVLRALEVGIRLGYLQRIDGRLAPGSPTLQTPMRVANLASWAYHRDGLDHATNGLQKIPGDYAYQEECVFVGGTFAIPQGRVGELRKVLYETIHRVSTLTDEYPEPPDRVVHLTVAMVPVASSGERD